MSDAAAPQTADRWKPEPAVIDLAARALRIAIRGPVDAEMLDIAQRVVERIVREDPQYGLWTACLAWCDTVQARTEELADPAALADVGLAFENASNGRRTLATPDVPPATVWAGRFLMARLRDDSDTSLALFNSHTDEGEFGSAVMALLSMAALTITQGVRTGSAAEVLSS